MKIRIGFVTNSSSSSFIINRKKELTEKQKDAIIAYILKEILGDTEITAENLEEICSRWDIDEDEKAQIESELAKGNAVYHGLIIFDDGRDLADIYTDIWDVIKQADPERFNGIKTDLCY